MTFLSRRDEGMPKPCCPASDRGELELSDGLWEAVCAYAWSHHRRVYTEVVSFLLQQNNGRGAKGTAEILREHLLVVLDCRRKWLRDDKGIGLLVDLNDEGAKRLRKLYGSVTGLGVQVEAICRMCRIPRFGNGGGPGIVVCGNMAFLADELL